MNPNNSTSGVVNIWKKWPYHLKSPAVLVGEGIIIVFIPGVFVYMQKPIPDSNLWCHRSTLSEAALLTVGWLTLRTLWQYDKKHQSRQIRVSLSMANSWRTQRVKDGSHKSLIVSLNNRVISHQQTVMCVFNFQWLHSLLWKDSNCCCCFFVWE